MTSENSTDVARVNVDPTAALDSPPQPRSIYFDFDSFTVEAEYQILLKIHADFLMSQPEQQVVIQGNTDPRGSSEYNLGLGARRANEVAQVFFAIGVTPQQVRTVSFGKEHATGEGEASWTLDRRADLVYSKSGGSS
ncbi:Peptidoglycan-associated lipoprotein [Paraburkholderia nemoris]|uniref:OmpA family protein n=1 Tax=Paraburkholderia nemoris TaxID=2793076 RepID=UPI0019144B0F|nr:OmpA family protein [Paraburkholderia nemoris]MBK5149720.1 OmpA family protein [Burkholderia sp. R-69608]CAE6938146.1 Peptidoglycan-associated lipoprotein [Paraburkholderia nemoris]